MKVKNLKNLIEQVRPFLDEYLEMHDTEFGATHFTCPNRVAHARDDYKPSAAHYPNNDGFKCFSCEVAGDIFTAANYLEGKPLTGTGFVSDNVLYLATLFGIDYELDDLTEEETYKDELSRVLQDANNILTKTIKADHAKVEEVKQYLEFRGWEDVQEDFEFGYGIYKNMIKILKSKGYEDKVLKDAGLMNPKEDNEGYELFLFEDRLVFPIKNHYDKIVGFGSRLIRPPANEKEQKYLQSRNNLLYNKTNTLFNLNRNRGQKKVYIVEGYGDVFTLHKHGIKNVIALCGLSFKEDRYKLLVKNGIEECVFCFDNDGAGQDALKRIIDRDIKQLSGLTVYIKNIPESSKFKDMDELVSNEGIDGFVKIPELTIFEWKLDELQKEPTNNILKNDSIQYIVREEDYTLKERMCGSLSEVIDVSVEAVKQEVNRHKKVDNGKYLATTETIFEEMNSFERVLLDWDRKVWSRGNNLLGLKLDGFPIFTKKMDGLQNGVYLVMGKTNLGKSAYLLNVGLDLLASNENVFVLFFSVDDTLNQLLPRMVALDTEIPINTIANPKFKIEFNENLPDSTKKDQLLKRHEGVNKLKGYSDRFAIKDESQAKRIGDIERYIDIYKNLAGDKQLVVLIDNVHRISSKDKMETRQLMMAISDKLKHWKNHYEIPVIATGELKKTGDERRPNLDDIKETGDFAYDADAVGLLYNDFYANPDTHLKFEYEGELLPIVEMSWAKNKTSDFKGKIYYKFYPEVSKYVECSYDEAKQLLDQERGG